ncbi:MAG: hypothetical protein JST05_09175 [Acidobacteria bacterium]|nr:hypothetical protein [Acidobacteriota bacterium]
MLRRLGVEAVSLLAQGDYQELANRFGYALAFGKGPAKSIRDDMEACLSESDPTSTLAMPIHPEITVKYFNADKQFSLFALVDCRLKLADGSGSIQVELVCSEKENERHVTLEQISRYA